MIYQNEIDPKCQAVLRRHFPEDIIDGRSIVDVRPEDLRDYQQCHFFAGIGGFSLGFARAGVPAGLNIWTGGFPCQDLSVAGKRKGMAGERSGLYFEFQRLIGACRPDWVVLENVPGLLSSNERRDFALVIGGLTGVVPDVPKGGWGNAGFFRGPVYNVAYRVLDAQFFGVPQRRRRVFIVASLGDGRAAEVLFERESLPGDTAPRREAGQGFTYDVAPVLSASGRGVERAGESRGQDCVVAFGGNNTSGAIDVATACNAHGGTGRMDFESETFIAWEMSHADEVVRESQPGLAPTLQSRMGTGGNQVPMVGVRRLTPTEYERLQGFPDGWTDGQADSARYRQLGNAVAVPVIEWIGRRITAVLEDE